MEVRLLSVCTRGFFARRFATRLRGFAPNEKKKPLVPGYDQTYGNMESICLVTFRKKKLFCAS